MKKYCVYSHSLDGRIFYIGCGSKERSRNVSNRSWRWLELVNGRQTDIKIRIIKRFDNKIAAGFYEWKLIEKHTPLANKAHNPIYRGDGWWTWELVRQSAVA